MLKFDRGLLENRLARVRPCCRVLFALAIAERLFPLYESFCEKTERGRSNYLRSTLSHLWDSTSNGQKGPEESFLNDYESLSPGEDAEWSLLNPLAENAVAALAYACQCQLTGGTESAAWAAVQGYEAVDYLAHTIGGIEFACPGAETAILKTEYVQAEIQRQLRDIAELENVSRDGSDVRRYVESFRSRAKSEGVTLVAVASALCK